MKVLGSLRSVNHVHHLSSLFILILSLSIYLIHLICSMCQQKNNKFAPLESSSRAEIARVFPFRLRNSNSNNNNNNNNNNSSSHFAFATQTLIDYAAPSCKCCFGSNANSHVSRLSKAMLREISACFIPTPRKLILNSDRPMEFASSFCSYRLEM